MFQILDPGLFNRCPLCHLTSEKDILHACHTSSFCVPGHGKSTFLKALAGRLRKDPHLTGQVKYNGMDAEQLEKHGLRLDKLTALVEQTDIHMALLTVKETLAFAAENAVADSSLLPTSQTYLLLYSSLLGPPTMVWGRKK